MTFGSGGLSTSAAKIYKYELTIPLKCGGRLSCLFPERKSFCIEH